MTSKIWCMVAVEWQQWSCILTPLYSWSASDGRDWHQVIGRSRSHWGSPAAGPPKRPCPAPASPSVLCVWTWPVALHGFNSRNTLIKYECVQHEQRIFFYIMKYLTKLIENWCVDKLQPNNRLHKRVQQSTHHSSQKKLYRDYYDYIKNSLGYLQSLVFVYFLVISYTLPINSLWYS